MSLSPDDLRELRELLVADRDRTRELIGSLGANVESIIESTRLTSTDDEHDPEGATIAFERSQASSLLASATEHLADIEAAMMRWDAGEYGLCEACGEPIPRERLEARPAARRCVSCAERFGPSR